MRTIMLIGVALSIAVIAPGACKSNEDVEKDHARKAIEGGEAGKAEPQTAPGKAAREFVEVRDRYLEKLNAELVDLDDKIARLSRDLESRRAEVNAELADRIAELERKRAEAREALNQAESASEERWDQIKNRTNEIVHGIRDAYEEVARELSESPTDVLK